MIELSRHIESLMLKHDCVIVPGLGGFVTQYVPARRVDDEQLFLPPCRSVGFNPQLNLNDGLLVQSYMQAYDTNYPETIKLIDDAVAQLKKELQEQGEYELSGIGKLTLGIGDKYNFTPCEAGVLSPELYGLDAVTTPRITDLKEEDAQPKGDQKLNNKKKIHVNSTEKSYTISINRELVNYVAAAVVAIFFYLIWATPINNNNPTKRQMASAVYEQLFNSSTQAKESAAQTSQATPIHLPITTTEQPNTHLLQAPNEASNDLVEAQHQAQLNAKNADEGKVAQADGNFTLVLASAITKSNAQVFANKLKAEGLKEALPYKRGRMVRVVYGHYPTEQAAQQALSKLQAHQAFADAWVMEVK